jgi:hypothetical protein
LASFKHRYITNPTVTEADIAVQAIRDLTKALKTKAMMDKVRQILDYVASQEEAVLTYRASKMILAVHSDAGAILERIRGPK